MTCKGIKGILLALIISSLALSGAASHAAWTEPANLTNTTNASYYPSVARDDDGIHVAWLELTSGGGRTIYYRRSTNNGASWTQAGNLSSLSGEPWHPIIISAGGSLHVTWNDQRTPNSSIYYRRSDDGGDTWSAEKLAALYLPGDFVLGRLGIAVNGQNIYIAVYANVSGIPTLHVLRSSNGGNTWSAPVKIAEVGGINSQSRPSISCHGGAVHVMWQEMAFSPSRDLIKYSRSLDGGSTWSATQVFIETTESLLYPTIISDGSALHATYLMGTSRMILRRKSSDNGITWTPEEPITSIFSKPFYYSMVFDSGEMNMAWADNRNTTTEVYFRRTSGGGAIFEPEERAAIAPNATLNYVEPALAVSGNLATVFWSDYGTIGLDIFFSSNTAPDPVYYSIHGSVMLEGETDHSGVAVSWGPYSTTTAQNGVFEISGVLPGTNDLMAEISGYNFEPVNFTNPVTVSGADVNNRQIRGTLDLWPIINSISPFEGKLGQVVTINGENLGESQGIVRFDGEIAPVSMWTKKQVIFCVPLYPTATGQKLVSIEAGAKSSNIVEFNLISTDMDTETPAITVIDPVSGPLNTRVTLTGKRFGLTEGSLYMNNTLINDYLAEPWNEDTIVFNVPEDAVLGENRIFIAANGLVSNTVYFTATSGYAVGGGGDDEPTINYPNPFDPTKDETTTFEFDIDGPTDVAVYVYDVTGRMVWRTEQSVTTGQVIWDGRDHAGKIAATGTYLALIIDSGNNTLIGKCKPFLIKEGE